MKYFLNFLCLLLCANLSLSQLVCPQTKEPPQEIENDPSFNLEAITYSDVQYRTIQIANRIFLNKNKEGIYSATSELYDDSAFCPDDFIIPLKEDYESIIEQLGSKAYATFIDPNGLNMQVGKYYLTNTKGQESMNKIFMYLDGNDIKFSDSHPFRVNGACRCMLDLSRINLIFPDVIGDIELNQDTKIKTNREKYSKGFLWKIEDKTFTTKEIEYKFEKSGMHMVEFWGNYINGETLYLCENVFVKKKIIKKYPRF